MNILRLLRPPASFPFMSEESRREVYEKYDQRVAALPLVVERRMVATRFGQAHVLSAGPHDAPPLLALHGLNITAPRNLAFFQGLARHFRIHAPDTPGQPGCSAPATLDWGRGEYGAWVADVLDGLGLQRVRAVGVSFGGAMLLQAAILAPERFLRAGLVVPAGIIPINALPVLFRLVLPAVLYRLWPRPSFLARQVGALSSEVSDDLLDLFQMIGRHVYPTQTPPPAFKMAALRRFTAPVMVVAASEDVFFPLARLRRRAPLVLPGLQEVKVVEGRHIPTVARQLELNLALLPFLQA